MFPKTKNTPAMPEVKLVLENEGKEQFTANAHGSIVLPLTAKEKELQKIVFNMKFNYDTLLNFTRDLLTHDQHVKFAAKKKEIFG